MDDQVESRSLGLKRLAAFIGAGVVVCTFALLIWAKLRMVTGVPRTAYAEPEQQQSGPASPRVKVQRKPARSASREALHQQQQASAGKTEEQVRQSVPVEGSGGL
ncbi:MAG: hypothetical protein U0637_09700 [Phycisphaerales bacterium]